jgi:hypothetical protein
LAAFQHPFGGGNSYSGKDCEHRDDNKKLNEGERFMTLLG